MSMLSDRRITPRSGENPERRARERVILIISESPSSRAHMKVLKRLSDDIAKLPTDPHIGRFTTIFVQRVCKEPSLPVHPGIAELVAEGSLGAESIAIVDLCDSSCGQLLKDAQFLNEQGMAVVFLIDGKGGREVMAHYAKEEQALVASKTRYPKGRYLLVNAKDTPEWIHHTLMGKIVRHIAQLRRLHIAGLPQIA